ncbi:MAG: ATP-binding protein [Planctomycetes bacterium]|nr:ATP-binding protein [Planctomycetota bacterium]
MMQGSQARYEERLVLKSTPDCVSKARESLLSAAQMHGYDQSCCFGLRLALEEAIANAIQHGNHNNPGKAVTVNLSVDRGRVKIDITDEGEGFDPDSVPDPTRDENLLIPAGRGLTLMRAFMTDVQFTPKGNQVCMTFVRPEAEGE